MKNKKQNSSAPHSTASRVTSQSSTAQRTAQRHSIPLLSIIRLHLYLFIVLIPLIFLGEFQTIFTIPKLLILRGLTLSAIFFIIIQWLTEGKKKTTLKLPQATPFLLLWLFSLIISSIFSLNQISSIWGQYGRFAGLITMVNFLLIPFFVIGYFDKKDLPKIINISCFTALLVALYGIAQYYDFFGLWKPNFAWSDSPQNRIFSTIGHANHLGGYLAAHVLLSGIFVLPKSSLLKKIAKLLTIAVFLYAITLTASRGAVFALCTGLLAAFIALLKYRSTKKTSTLLGKVSIIFLLIIIPVASIFSFHQSLGEIALFQRTEQTIETVNKGIIPDRLSFLFSAGQMLLDHPLVGTGLSTFRDAYSAYRRSDYVIDGPGNTQYITVPEAAHNEYANILATQGAFGLLVYLALLSVAILTVSKALRAAREEPQEKALIIQIFGAFLVYLLQTLFNFGEIVNLSLCYLLLGLIFLYAPVHQVNFQLKTIFKYLLALPIIIALAFGIKILVLDLANTDYALKQAKIAWAGKNGDLANNWFERAVSSYPWEYQLYQVYGDFSLDLATTQTDRIFQENSLKQAVRNYQEAIKLNPNYPSTYHNLGLAYLYLFRLTQNPLYKNLSQQSYQRSIEKSPNNPRYIYEYARKLHSDWDNKAQAVKLLKQALEIAPNYQEPQDYLNFLYKNHPELISPLK